MKELLAALGAIVAALYGKHLYDRMKANESNATTNQASPASAEAMNAITTAVEPNSSAPIGNTFLSADSALAGENGGAFTIPGFRPSAPIGGPVAPASFAGAGPGAGGRAFGTAFTPAHFARSGSSGSVGLAPHPVARPGGSHLVPAIQRSSGLFPTPYVPAPAQRAIPTRTQQAIVRPQPRGRALGFSRGLRQAGRRVFTD